MRKLGTVDLEILHLAKKENGTFNEKNLENSNLKRFGVGRILDALASLKDRKMISLNEDGSFTITQFANEILWSSNIPIWAKILRLLQIKSCRINEITDILNIKEEEITEDLEKLRKSQFILMSPQRQEEKLVKIFEILPEGIEEIDKTETQGFDKIKFEESRDSVEIISLIDEVIREIQNSNLEIPKKNNMVEKLFKLKEKLEI